MDVLTVKEVQQKIKSFRTQMIKEGRNLISSQAKTLFEEYPALTSFSWKQFTPSYCDGDPCRFMVFRDADSIGLNVQGWGPYLHMEDIQYEEWYERIDGKNRYKLIIQYPDLVQYVPIYNEIVNMLQLFSDEDLEDIIGEEGLVTVNRNGEVTVEYYRHD